MTGTTSRQLNRAVYHVVNWAVNEEPILGDPGAKALLLDRFRRFSAERSARIYHWVLMPNHFHLAVEVRDADDLCYLVGQVTRSFGLAWRRQNGPHGPLWHGRFHSFLVQKAGYLERLGRYIERNPLRVGLPGVAQPWDYEWSSARAYVCGVQDPLVVPAHHPGWLEMGVTDDERHDSYARYLLSPWERTEDEQRFRSVGPAGVVGDRRFQKTRRQPRGPAATRPRRRRQQPV